MVKLGLHPSEGGRSLDVKVFDVTDQIALMHLVGHPGPEVVDRLSNVGRELLPAALTQQLEGSLPVNLLRRKFAQF